MPRRSQATVQARRTPKGTLLPAVEFPSGRLVVQNSGTILFYDDAAQAPLIPVPVDRLNSNEQPRTGVINRIEDQSGVSGTGVVADFVEFPTGWVIQEWRNEDNPGLETDGPRDSGMDFRPSMSMAVQIHGHKGRTEYLYDNGEVAEP